MNRAELIEYLTGRGWVVRPWSYVANGHFLIVRPGGVRGTRPVHEVWLVGPTLASEPDPDEGLQEMSERLYRDLSSVLSEVDVTPGPVYDPNRGAPHATMLATGVTEFAGLGC